MHHDNVKVNIPRVRNYLKEIVEAPGEVMKNTSEKEWS